MNIFKNIFNNKKENLRVFPKECNDGNVRIENNQIICEGAHDINSCVVNLADLQYAYVTIRQDKLAYLFLFDYHQNSIPITYKGFKTVYTELSNRFNFNDDLFFENINKKEVTKREIWRKKYEPTFEILKSNYTDYNQGFEIQAKVKEFISWDTTYDKLEKSENIIFETSPYGQKVLKFKYPTRIGNIILNDFSSYFDNGRTDVAVLNYYTQCYNHLGTDKSYNDLKDILKKDISINEKTHNYEREDQKHINFDLGGINLSICYTYDSDWLFNGGYTSLSIENKRHYDELLSNKKYEERIVISDFLKLDGNVRISEDYKRNKRVKRRPEQLNQQFENHSVIWIDNTNEKIGFSSNNFSQVFDINEIKLFHIQNILPAKGGGGSYLELIMENQKYNYSILTESCHFFDKYAKDIKKLTRKDVIFGKEYHDC